MFGSGILATVIVSGLVVSTGAPSPEAKQEYLEWGANHVTVWQADEGQYWEGIPTTVWTHPDGTGQHWTRQPTEWERTPNVVREQVGDEPQAEPWPLSDPESQYTNFSYWAPLALERWPEEAMPGIMDAYEGSHFTTSEYLIRDPAHWQVLDFFRGKAAENGQTWGVYLNGYEGYETEFEADHTAEELYTHAFGAQAFGASEFVWFTYAFGPDGHEEAVQGGGSIITNGQSWEKGSHWEITKGINEGLRYFGDILKGQPTDVRFGSDVIVGTFATGTLIVGVGGGEVNVEGYAINPHGVGFAANGTLAVGAGDVFLVTQDAGAALIME